MKKTKINPQFQPFFNMSRRLWRSSGGSLGVYLPEKWCSRHGIGHLAEIEMWVFPDILLVFPPGKHQKPSEFKSRLLSAVTMMELWEELRNAIKDAEQAFKGFKRRPSRDKRKR